MKIIPFLFLSLLLSSFQNEVDDEKYRFLTHNHNEVKTTFKVDDKFYGTYKGRKQGYLTLKSDGTGVYRYDYQAFLPENCEAGEISFDWGLIVDENDELVKFQREYGYSYPIIYSCNGNNSFQGCTKTSLIDYILIYNDGTMTVSSSDDWEKIADSN